MYSETASNTTFTGVLFSNKTLSMAKAYAVKTGEKENYHKLRSKCKELPGDVIRIIGHHNYKPIESVRTIISVTENNKIIKKLDIFTHEIHDVGEAVYNLLKKLTDKNSDIYKNLFV